MAILILVGEVARRAGVDPCVPVVSPHHSDPVSQVLPATRACVIDQHEAMVAVRCDPGLRYEVGLADEIFMALTMNAEEMIDRLHRAAIVWDAEQELAVMQPAWDPATSTDKALRDCVFDNSIAAIGFVKRRYRSDALEAVAAATFEGYMKARYLLGTGAARPMYSRSDNEVTNNADRINRKMKAFSFDKVIWALSGGDNDLVKWVGETRARFPLNGVIKQDKSDAMFLASYCLGIAAAMAEEQLFGPLA